MPEKVLLSRKEVAPLLGVSLPLVDKLIREGRLGIVRVGGRVLIPRASLEKFARPTRAKR